MGLSQPHDPEDRRTRSEGQTENTSLQAVVVALQVMSLLLTVTNEIPAAEATGILVELVTLLRIALGQRRE
jgi:hypothetical protein